MNFAMSDKKVVDMLRGGDLPKRASTIKGRASTTLNGEPIEAFFTKNLFYVYFNDHWYNGYIVPQMGEHPNARKYIEAGNGFTTARPVKITPVSEEDIPVAEESDNIENPETFKYENDLQDSMVFQINELFPEYKIFGENNEGVEYRISGKRIDILLEKHNGDLLVIELKSGIADRDVHGQISMYIGLLMEKFPERVIKGFIIAGKMDDNLKYAVKTTDHIGLKTYKMKFIKLELNDE